VVPEPRDMATQQCDPSRKYKIMISMQTGNADIVGENVVMCTSDYPHRESAFPGSTNIELDWDMPAVRKHKLFWENPTRRSGL
jgi:predicted TIM-barrel fold metal-dependent hydrolase